jgi:hypothetical protein
MEPTRIYKDKDGKPLGVDYDLAKFDSEGNLTHITGHPVTCMVEGYPEIFLERLKQAFPSQFPVNPRDATITITYLEFRGTS